MFSKNQVKERKRGLCVHVEHKIMSLDEIIVTLVGVLGIIFTFWFFLMKKEQEVVVSDLPAGRQGSVDIEVLGGYSPEVISIPKGKTTKLNFIRKDPTDCLEEIVLGDFKVRRHLPLNQKVTVEVTPQKEGEYVYSCGMNMYHGKIIVR